MRQHTTEGFRRRLQRGICLAGTAAFLLFFFHPASAQRRVRPPKATPPRPPISICEAAQKARARNSPAAPSLMARCNAIINDLAARGGAIADQDMLAAALRYRQTEGPGRRGFDIGMAAVEKETMTGPAKQAIHDELSSDEQVGYEVAFSFSLERNRNAKRAAIGAAIARVDSDVAQGRIVEKDPFYSLGFDIATGIFGDPAKGAQGDAATGPGSLEIRDSLSAAGRRGFNASVALHLSRNYTGMAGPSITVSDSVGTGPFTVYTRGMPQRTINIGWKTGPAYTYCEIQLSVDKGEWSEFARGQDGSKPTDIKLGSSYTFRMMVYEGQARTPKVVKTITVNGVL